jgi:hypothetical protein
MRVPNVYNLYRDHEAWGYCKIDIAIFEFKRLGKVPARGLRWRWNAPALKQGG